MVNGNQALIITLEILSLSDQYETQSFFRKDDKDMAYVKNKNGFEFDSRKKWVEQTTGYDFGSEN